MKKLILAASFAALLSACGSSDDGRQALIDSCMSEGNGATQEMCECTADAMKDGLKDGTYDKLVAAAKAGKTDPEEMMGDFSEAEQMEFMGAAMGMMKCIPPDLMKDMMK